MREEVTFGLAESFREEFELQLKRLKRFTNHGPTLGRYVETLLINLLKKYSPRSIEFSSGFLHSTSPSIEIKSSPQIDIICYDRINYPIIFDSNEFVVVSPSSSKSFVEIKSTLTKGAIEKGLTFLESSLLKEVPLSAKLYFVASTSTIKSKAIFELLKSYYLNQPHAIRFIGGIYSLDWNEMIHCDSRLVDEKELEITFLRLSNSLGIAPFFSSLLLNCCSIGAYESIANLLNPTLYTPIDSFSIKLYSNLDLSSHFNS